MSWNAASTIRDAAEAKFTGSAFSTILTAVNAAEGTSAPQIASDGGTTSGKAVYTLPQTTYVFPCVEITPPEGRIEQSGGSTTSEPSFWVYLSFRGSAQELDAWALVYLTALAKICSASTSSALPSGCD